jgi:hypothetical protein
MIATPTIITKKTSEEKTSQLKVLNQSVECYLYNELLCLTRAEDAGVFRKTGKSNPCVCGGKEKGGH